MHAKFGRAIDTLKQGVELRARERIRLTIAVNANQTSGSLFCISVVNRAARGLVRVVLKRNLIPVKSDSFI
jgi:hypothetical protein